MDLLATAQRILAVAGVRVDLETWILLFGLVLARLLPALLLAPFFGGQTVPGRVRVGFAALFSALLLPYVTPAAAPTFTTVFYVALIAKEVMAGFLLGVVCQFVFYGIQAAGVLIDTQRGMNQLNYVAPQLPGPSSLLGQLKLQTAIALFVAGNGHLLYLNALANSFATLPLTSFPRIEPGATALLEAAARLSANSLVIALQLAAPLLIVLLLVDVSFGMLNRIANQINVHQESQPVKALAGLGVFLLMLGFLVARMQGYLGEIAASVEQVVRSLRP